MNIMGMMGYDIYPSLLGHELATCSVSSVCHSDGHSGLVRFIFCEKFVSYKLFRTIKEILNNNNYRIFNSLVTPVLLRIYGSEQWKTNDGDINQHSSCSNTWDA